MHYGSSVIGLDRYFRNKIIPGIKKLLKREFPEFDNGILSSSPEGEIISAPPLTIAPKARKAIKKRSTFLIANVFIIISFFIFKYLFKKESGIRYL